MSDITNPKKSPVAQGLRSLEEGLPRMPDEAGVRLVIWILLAVVVGLNVLAVAVYGLEKNLADYFDSKSYDALLATLLIPLLLSFVSRAFKIDEKVQAEQKQLEHDKKEAQLRLEQERRRKQIATIEKTNAMWSELYSLSTELAYFEAAHKEPVREIRKKLEGFTNWAEEVVNLWYLNFPRLPTEVPNLFLPGFNVLLLSTKTIADVIEDGDKETKSLQNCLLVIQDGVRSGLHYSIMQIFYLAMDGQEPELQKQISILRGWGGFFKELLKNLPPNLPPGDEATRINGARTDYQSAFESCHQAKMVFDQFDAKLKAAADAAARQQILDSAEYKTAWAAFDKAAKAHDQAYSDYKKAILESPAAGLELSRKKIFSNEQIKKLAAEMYFQNDLLKIQTAV